MVDRWHEHPKYQKVFHKDVRLEDCLPSWVKPNQGNRNTVTINMKDLAKDPERVRKIGIVFL